MGAASLYLVLCLWVFWYAYILVMGIYRAHLSKRLGRFATIMALPAVVVGYALDIAANLTIATVFFLELPCEFTVTHRLRRYMQYPMQRTWRGVAAVWVCHNLLDVFDPDGKHC